MSVCKPDYSASGFVRPRGIWYWSVIEGMEGLELDLGGVLDRGDLRYPEGFLSLRPSGHGSPGRSPCVLRALALATVMDFGRYLWVAITDSRALRAENNGNRNIILADAGTTHRVDSGLWLVHPMVF